MSEEGLHWQLADLFLPGFTFDGSYVVGGSDEGELPTPRLVLYIVPFAK